MPELPEVAALADDLRGRLKDRAIARVHVPQFSALKTYDPPISAVEGTLVDDVTRHGKFIDIEASGLHLVIHLARGGWIRWREEVPAVPPRPGQKSGLAVRIVLDPSTGSGQAPGLDITEGGTKKRLALYVVHDPHDVPGIATLGPDPLAETFTVEQFRSILAGQGRKQIKGVLRQQGLIAGIGNAYSDEILWAARMSPYKPAEMSEEESGALYEALRTTLTEAVERSSGLAMSELKGEKKSSLAVHGKAGQKCPRCGDVVREVSFADSALQYCATCQTGGKPLADRRMSKLLK